MFQKALDIDPNDAKTNKNMALALRSLGQHEDAQRFLRKAVALTPDDANLRFDLAVSLATSGQWSDALSQFRQAATDNANLIERINMIVIDLASDPDLGVRQRKQAIRLAQLAVELTGRRDSVSLDALAVAYASTGQYERAVATAAEALEIASSIGNQPLIDGIIGHLESYKEARQKHEPQ